MASAVLLYRVTFPKLLGALGDAPVNDIVFMEEPAVPFSATDAAVVDFYTHLYPTQTNTLSSYFSPCIDRGVDAVQVNVYDITTHLDGSAAGPPVHMFNFTLSALLDGGHALPEQVSFVINHDAGLGNLSEFGPIVSTIPTDDRAQDEGAPATHTGRTRPRSRRRGRMFLPPLCTLCVQDETDTGEAIPTALFGADVGKAALGFHGEAASIGADWAVWSRRNADVQATLHGWLRVAFATSRRRARENAVKVNWL